MADDLRDARHREPDQPLTLLGFLLEIHKDPGVWRRAMWTWGMSLVFLVVAMLILVDHLHADDLGKHLWLSVPLSASGPAIYLSRKARDRRRKRSHKYREDREDAVRPGPTTSVSPSGPDEQSGRQRRSERLKSGSRKRRGREQ